jgi:hypothetical protein
LRARTAAVAGIIFNEVEPSDNAHVIGFGCLSVFSRNLSEMASKYVTTIVSDSDMIPRLSGPSLTNAFFAVTRYDYGSGIIGQHDSGNLKNLIGIGYNRMLLDYMMHVKGDYQFIFEQQIV